MCFEIHLQRHVSTLSNSCKKGARGMMPSKMVIATILSSAARAIAIFLLSLLLKLNDDLYWVLPWLRQMTIRIEVVFFIFLIQCGGSSRGAPSIHVASLSPTRVYCFHFNCAIVVAAAAPLRRQPPVAWLRPAATRTSQYRGQPPPAWRQVPPWRTARQRASWWPHYCALW